MGMKGISELAQMAQPTATFLINITLRSYDLIGPGTIVLSASHVVNP